MQWVHLSICTTDQQQVKGVQQSFEKPELDKDYNNETQLWTMDSAIKCKIQYKLCTQHSATGYVLVRADQSNFVANIEQSPLSVFA